MEREARTGPSSAYCPDGEWMGNDSARTVNRRELLALTAAFGTAAAAEGLSHHDCLLG